MGLGNYLILAEKGFKVLIGALVGEVAHKDLHHLVEEVQGSGIRGVSVTVCNTIQ